MGNNKKDIHLWFQRRRQIVHNFQNSNTHDFQLRFQLVFSHVASSSPSVCGSPSPYRVLTVRKYKDQLFFPSGEQKKEIQRSNNKR